MSRRPHRTIGLNFCVGHLLLCCFLLLKGAAWVGPTHADVIRNRRKPTSQRVVLHLYLAKAGPCAPIHRDNVAVTKGWIARSGLSDSSPYAVASNEKKFFAELQCGESPMTPGARSLRFERCCCCRPRSAQKAPSSRAPPIRPSRFGQREACARS